MELVLFGLNHKTSPVQVRERLAISVSHLPEILRALRAVPNVHEIAIVSTCNRFEVYGIATNAHHDAAALLQTLADHRNISLNDFVPYLYTCTGADAARHLCRVAAGLDSMLMGEHQILGQVKDAYQAALDARTGGAILSALFRQAIHAGKRARAETNIGDGARSLGQVAVTLSSKVLGDLTNHTALLVGVGKINKLAGRALLASGLRWLLIANRTFEHAEELSRTLGGSAVHFDALNDCLAQADLVIVATGAPHIVLHAQDLRQAMTRRTERPLVIIDLAVPRNVDPETRGIHAVHLYDMDDLNAVIATEHPVAAQAIEATEEVVAEETAAFLEWWEERRIVMSGRGHPAWRVNSKASNADPAIQQLVPDRPTM